MENETQKSGIPLPVLLAFSGFGLLTYAVQSHPDLIWALLLCVLVGLLVYFSMKKRQEQREATARAASYANICGPVVIATAEPNETVDALLERVAAFKEQLQLSGNPYADKIPVVAYPYRPMIYGPGQLTMAWNIFQRQALEQQHLENERWATGPCPNELRATFQSQVMNQIPVASEN